MLRAVRCAVDQRAEYIFASSPRRGTVSTRQRHLLPVVCVCVVRTSADVCCVFESVTARCLPAQLKIPSHGPLMKRSPFGQRDRSTGGCGIAAAVSASHFRVP